MTDALKPPTMTYEAIEADIQAQGREARDLLGSDGHYDAWHKAKGLPKKDGQGKHFGSSQEFFRAYQDDPAGADARPPYADLWQFLLKAGEPVEWTEGRGERTKTIPVCSAMFADPPDWTEEQIAAGRARIEEHNGAPMEDRHWDEFARDVRKGPAAARRCIQEIRDVLERHGQPHPEFGNMLMVTLTVSC